MVQCSVKNNNLIRTLVTAVKYKTIQYRYQVKYLTVKAAHVRLRVYGIVLNKNIPVAMVSDQYRLTVLKKV